MGLAGQAGVLSLMAILLAQGARASFPLDSGLFAPVGQLGSDNTDYAAWKQVIGCTGNGATLQYIGVWSNPDYIRGIRVGLTDGTNVTLGCGSVSSTVKDGQSCTGTGSSNVRFQDFTFAPNERVAALWMWNGTYGKSLRTGAIVMQTVLPGDENGGRTFDVGTGLRPAGVDAKVKNIGSGIPCGVVASPTIDADGIGLVFLNPVASASLNDVSYEGVPTRKGENAFGLGGTQLWSEQLQNQTYNNSGGSSDHTYTFASDLVQARVSAWSQASRGLDAYLGGTVLAGTPTLLAGGDGEPLAWDVAPVANHSRSETPTVIDRWSYTIPVLAGGVTAAYVSTTQARVNVPYSGTLNVVLTSGAVMKVPVTGTFFGTTHSTPLRLETRELVKPTPATAPLLSPLDRARGNLAGVGILGAQAPESSTSSSSDSNKWVIYLVVGIVAGLALAALIIVGTVCCVRKKKKEDPSPQAFVVGRPVEDGEVAGFKTGKKGDGEEDLKAKYIEAWTPPEDSLQNKEPLTERVPFATFHQNRMARLLGLGAAASSRRSGESDDEEAPADDASADAAIMGRSPSSTEVELASAMSGEAPISPPAPSPAASTPKGSRSPRTPKGPMVLPPLYPPPSPGSVATPKEKSEAASSEASTEELALESAKESK